MLTIICLVLTVGAVFGAVSITKSIKAGVVAGAVGLILTVVQMGIYYIPAKHSGHVTMKLGQPLTGGQLIARDGQRGEQATLLTPGIGYNFLYPWFMDIEIVKDLDVPSGHFATIKARDGAINPKIVAPKWDKDLDPKKMLEDVEYFMDNGGSRGVQQFIVTTGNYRINQFQWSYEMHRMKNVNSTEVMVIESKFGKAPAFTETSDDEILSVPLVPSNEYRGIVNQAFPSGMYAVHPYTEQAHSVPIMLQTFIYGGGYNSKTMDLRIDAENDKLITVEDSRNIPTQKHGGAFAAKTKDNHTVYIDVRVLGQIEPVQAPRFIGTIKDISKLDDQIIEPYTKNILTNIVLGYDAMDLKDRKEELGEKLSEALRERTQKTGFRTKTVEITNIDIPPIVLISKKIESASTALEQALIKKEKSVAQAIKVRNMQDQADNQEALAKATVANAAADQKAAEIKKMADAAEYRKNKEADAAKYQVEKQAEAYKILARTIGADRAADLMIQEKINEAADKFKVPEVVVIGGENGGEGSGTSIVSAHMISQAIKDAHKQMRNTSAQSGK